MNTSYIGFFFLLVSSVSFAAEVATFRNPTINDGVSISMQSSPRGICIALGFTDNVGLPEVSGEYLRDMIPSTSQRAQIFIKDYPTASAKLGRRGQIKKIIEDYTVGSITCSKR